MEIVKESEGNLSNILNIEIQKNELFRVLITAFKNGGVTIGALSKDGFDLTYSSIIGALDCAKVNHILGEKPINTPNDSFDSVDLDEGEIARLIISVQKNCCALNVKTIREDQNDRLELSGLIETAKYDLLSPKEKPDKMTEVVLEEKDFESFPELKDKLNLSAGDTVELPKAVVDNLKQARG